MQGPNGQGGRIKIGLVMGLMAGWLIALTGCGAYVDGGYYGEPVVVEPDVFLFGGVYEHGRDVHAYSHRGAESRGAAHSSGSHGGRR